MITVKEFAEYGFTYKACGSNYSYFHDYVLYNKGIHQFHFNKDTAWGGKTKETEFPCSGVFSPESPPIFSRSR